MRTNRFHIPLSVAIAVALLGSTAVANEVSWIPGQTSPSTWSIQPAAPHETEVISFSGPVDFYINYCVAESSIGGRPSLRVDYTNKTIEIRFDLPPRTDCTGLWSPVCGLKGSFGPLEVGQWRLFSTTSGAAFSLEFSVVSGEAVETVCYVDANAPGKNDGSSWKDAFLFLQDGLAATKTGEIRVARGIYRPDLGEGLSPGDQDAEFRLRGSIVLKGGYAGSRGPNPNERNVFAFETILSGDLQGDDQPMPHVAAMVVDYSRAENSRHVVTIRDTNAAPVLDGFTITGGIARGSDLATDIGGGGAIYDEGGNPIIRNCLIVSNGTNYYGGAICTRGPGAFTITDCTLANNWANWAGGAIYCYSNAHLVMDRCFLTSNGALYQGGAVASFGNARLEISSTLITGNKAMAVDSSRGGGVYGSLTRTYLDNCTIAGNLAASGTGVASGLYGSAANTELHLKNCIVWGDANDVVDNGDGSLFDVMFCDVRGGWDGAGNIDADPCFVQEGRWDEGATSYDPYDDTWLDGDYRLRWDSRCIDAGNVDYAWHLSEKDLDGQARVSGLAVDMGAYELRNDPPVADGGGPASGFTLTPTAKGKVAFDASKSYDPEGQPLTYHWYLNNQLVSEEVSFKMDLAIGQYSFKLVVTDKTGQSTTDEVPTTVSLLIGTQTFVSPRVIKRSGAGEIVTLTVMPKGKYPNDLDSTIVRLFPNDSGVGVGAIRQSAFMWFTGDALVMAAFRGADLMTLVPTNGPVQLMTVGRLKNGQYFGGSDTVTIQ
jgi:hypothetical protein